MDRIPVIAIDPKGDLGNLLLSFPKLRGGRFRTLGGSARGRGKRPDPRGVCRSHTAKLWRDGLKHGARHRRASQALRDAVGYGHLYARQFCRRAGVGAARIQSAPPAELMEDGDLYRERLQGTSTSLLTLLGIDADPVSSPEHILLAHILDQRLAGRPIAGPCRPDRRSPEPGHRAHRRHGTGHVLSRPRNALRSHYKLNNLLAAPGFDAWMQGEALNMDSLMFGPGGKPRVSVMSIAHLSDAERMFFVTMLLTELIAWMRQQPGTGSLRAILYMDEIFGYMPPVANPPAKHLFLTLLKQARAYGLGLVLATQNPVDLDYKGLSNTGTWFIGRLQTERDKARVRDGLLGAAGSDQLDPGELDADFVGTRQAPLPAAQRARKGAGAVRNALGHVLSRRTADARPDCSTEQGSAAISRGHRVCRCTCRIRQRRPPTSAATGDSPELRADRKSTGRARTAGLLPHPAGRRQAGLQQRAPENQPTGGLSVQR